MRRHRPLIIRAHLIDIVLIGIRSEMFCQGFPLDGKSQRGIMTPGFSGLNLLRITH
jgi:hypothetical protein